MSKNKLTKENIEHIAKLANVSITSEETEKYISQLEATIDYVENLNELDTANVLPTNHATDVKNVYFEDGEKCERMFTQKEALANAKETKNNMFIVKRIM